MPTIGSLFSGAGLLDLGLSRAGFDVIWHAETDKAASSVLEHHWPGVPNLGDVTAVDWSTIERPDVLCGGGWPCQPFSSAGKQEGADDERYMWPEVIRAVRILRPGRFVMEQSPAILARKFRPIWLTVLSDLAEAGFDAKWAVVRACDVGAPHKRARLILAAYAGGSAGRKVARSASGDEGRDEEWSADPTHVARGGGQTAAYANSRGCCQLPQLDGDAEGDPAGRCPCGRHVDRCRDVAPDPSDPRRCLHQPAGEGSLRIVSDPDRDAEDAPDTTRLGRNRGGASWRRRT